MPRPSSPLSDAEHIVLCCHDIDFYYIDWKSALSRVLKNICISCTVYRSASFFADNWRYLLRLLRGRSVGDYLSPLIESIERLGFRSTFFAVARQGHRRDPDYDLTHIAPLLIAVQKRGFPVALHGSYRSIIEDGSLAEEAQALSHAIGERIFGSRQHWLRFDLCEDLFREIEHAGLIFDSTLGFADKVGFRNGVSFAFPPYDFQKEAPCQFLELPLALMDGSLEATCRLSKEEPQDVANQVLDESMRWSWGGMAILWHDPLESVSVPSEINQVFWNCAKRQHASLERWMSTDQFLECCLSRYQNAGLLESVSPATCPSPS